MTGSPPEGTVLERISAMADGLSPKQHKLARHIFENCVPCSFLNITGLAAEAGVSESTVVRLAYSLGYDGFPDLQRSLRHIAQGQISSLDKYPLDEQESSLPLHRKVFHLESALLKETAETLTEEAFDRAIAMLRSAKHVFVVGTGPNRAVADYFSFYLRVLRPGVTFVPTLDLDLAHVLKGQGSTSLAVVFSFPRYPAMTQRITEKIRSRDIPVIGITDSALSPLAPLSDLLLESKMKFISFIDPSGGTMALMHSLLVGLYLQNPVLAKKQVRYFEDEVQEEKFFLRPDLDIVDLL
jgi:DNA-binding MurR/RpiR family transcriptional regulator